MAASGGGGVGFVGLLTIVFIVLKLTGYITWSWVWVLSPLWISFLVGLFFLGVMLAVVAATGGSVKRKRRLHR